MTTKPEDFYEREHDWPILEEKRVENKPSRFIPRSYTDERYE